MVDPEVAIRLSQRFSDDAITRELRSVRPSLPPTRALCTRLRY